MSRGARVRWYPRADYCKKKLLKALLPANLEHSMVLTPEKGEQDSKRIPACLCFCLVLAQRGYKVGKFSLLAQ